MCIPFLVSSRCRWPALWPAVPLGGRAPPGLGSSLFGGLPFRLPQQPGGDVGSPGGVAGDHQDGVVTGDRAEDGGPACVVEGGGEQLRTAGRGPQYDQVGAGLGAHQQLGGDPRQRPGEGGLGFRGRDAAGPRAGAAGPGGQRVDQGAAGPAQPDRAHLLQVAGQRGLRDPDAAPGQQRGEFLLRANLCLGQDPGDLLLARGLGRRVHRGHRARPAAGTWPGAGSCPAAAARARMPGNAARNAPASRSLRISGGASRMASGCTALTRNPASRQAASTAAATGWASTAASHSPSPRTPASSGWPVPPSPRARYRPTDAAWASSPSRSMVSSTASAAAHATGFPPKVLPWSPLRSAVPAAPSPMHAPIGSPPPSPLASVSTSGTTPAAWLANQAPVRPMPLWISSITSSAPAAWQASRAPRRYPAGAGTTPASPWPGSRKTAAHSGVTAEVSAARSP